MEPVRVRIAPSPTGDPHVGLAYVTLFNYVFAKKHGGKLILRIEDTDQTRAKASSELQIMECLKWLGLQWDEGPDVGGPCGPYRQSERRETHREHAYKLVNSGHAYCCFCSEERLTQVREEQKKAGHTTRYDGHCRNLSKDIAEKKREAGESHVVRLKMPQEGNIGFHDVLRGEITFEALRMDDQVLLKSDGYPTYHLANVVDDYLMGITHVMRAEEWISSTPKHVVLYESFGWKQPQFIHLPLLRNHDRSKISKRKNPTSLNYYRRKGVLPKALLNFLGLMGWSFGEDREFFNLEEMMERFELKNIHPGGPVFDLAKLTWLNQHYLHQMTQSEFVEHLRENIFTTEYLGKLYPLAKERLSVFEQFVDNNSFFFNGALSYHGVNLVPAGKSSAEMVAMSEEILALLDEVYEWNSASLQKVMDDHRAKLGWKGKDYFMTLRLLITGRKDSPPLAESMETIGREMVRFRLRDVVTRGLFDKNEEG